MIFGLLGEMVFYQKIFLQLGVLGAIGFASILSLPFMLISYKFRPIFAVLLLFSWQALQMAGFSADPLSGLGGVSPCLAWAAVILSASTLAEVPDKRNALYLVILAYVWLIPYLLRTMVFSTIPINKHYVTVSYILYTLQASVVIFSLLCWKDAFFWNWKLLSVLGKNSLVLYMISGLTSFFSGLWLGPTISMETIVPVAFTHIFLILLTAWLMDRKKIYAKI